MKLSIGDVVTYVGVHPKPSSAIGVVRAIPAHPMLHDVIICLLTVPDDWGERDWSYTVEDDRTVIRIAP